MKKIFLIFTLFVSSYVLAESRGTEAYSEKDNYAVCSSYGLDFVVACSSFYLSKGFKAQSGLHALVTRYGNGTPQGTLFFQAFIKN